MRNPPKDASLVTGDQRQFVRIPVQCRARIRIGKRHYTGYIGNLSEGGARLTTYTPIQDAGKVTVRIPDLPPLKGELRWSDGTAAGMAFCLRLSSEQLSDWARTRLSLKASPVAKKGLANSATEKVSAEMITLNIPGGRAAAEHQLKRAAKGPPAAEVHAELAARYKELALEIDAIDQAKTSVVTRRQFRCKSDSR